MEIRILPRQGIEIVGGGRILFGMTPEQVRSFFAEPPHSLMMGADDEVPTDCYDQASLRFFYNPEDGVLESVAVESEHEVWIETLSLFQGSVKQSFAWLRREDPEFELEEGVGGLSKKFGFLTTLAGEDEDDPKGYLDGVLIFQDDDSWL